MNIRAIGARLRSCVRLAPALLSPVGLACATAAAHVSDPPAPTNPVDAVRTSAAGTKPSCNKDFVVELAGTTVWKVREGKVLGFRGGMRIDASGAPRAYHPDSGKGLDDVAQAGQEGSHLSLITDTGKSDGRPVLQGRSDPAPGFFISATALIDKRKPVRSPARYVDSSAVPYIALPPEAKDWGVELGDFAVVMNVKTGRLAFAIVADVSAPSKLGEGSIALADTLEISPSPRDGGVASGVVYAVFLKSGNGAPRSTMEIDREGRRLFDAFGGRVAVATCFR